MDEALLVCHVRPARRRALSTAVTEALSLLGDLGAVAPEGGPLSDRGGVFWITLLVGSLDAARARLPRLGYTRAVDLLEPASDGDRSQRPAVRWRGGVYRLVRIYEEDAAAARESAPDRRTFVLETAAGEVRAVRGYRGDSGPLSRRGLPVYDARALVNLAGAKEGALVLDPFAGVGGVIREALAAGCRVASGDNDPALRHGLARLGSRHVFADARRLPFADATIDAVASEPPYDRQAEDTVVEALTEMGRVLKDGARLVLLSAAWQAEPLRRQAAALRLALCHEAAIDRKGLDCAVLVWRKDLRLPLSA